MKLQNELFALSTEAPYIQELLQGTNIWDVLTNLDTFAATIQDNRAGTIHPTAVLTGQVFVHETANIGPYAYIEGPAYIGPDVTIAHTAYLRGPVVLGPGAVVGHASEVKRSVFLSKARAAHFNYVGDSILGSHVNLGAGVKLANFKAFGDEITIDGKPSGHRKFGAAIGDYCSVGCNAVLSPGTVMGPHTIVYHGATVRGTIPGRTIVKFKPELEFAPYE